MRLSDENIAKLQVLLQEVFGLNYDAERVEVIGLDIMRFVLAKRQRSLEKKISNRKNNENEDMEQWLN